MSEIILFVEDNADLRENAALVLDLEGYTVRLARDGREALDLLEAGLVPHLIVSDIMMPRMDGYEFFQAVRQKAHLKAVPFIFLTARGSRHDISVGRLMGADDYLIKPFEPEEFLIAIQNKLQRAADMRAQATEILNDARRSLVQLLSHELHTPLTYVTGGFALLAEELEGFRGPVLSDDIRVSLSLIQSGTQRLNRLAEQTVLYSEIMSGYVAQQVHEIGEALDVEFLLSDALSLLDEYARERRTHFRRPVPQEGVIVHGVKDLLVTAISEVVRNAIQYSPEGAQVGLSVARDAKFGTLTVTDHGQGIPLENQATIWDVLIQLARERGEQQGVGMGLPIVKGIMTSHGGDAILHSVPGEGTQVTLHIPLALLSN